MQSAQKLFFGNGAEFVRAVQEQRHNWYAREEHAKYGPVVAFTVNGGMFVSVADAEISKQIHEKVGARVFSFCHIDPRGTVNSTLFTDAFSVMANGLITLKGDIWLRHRTCVTDAPNQLVISTGSARRRSRSTHCVASCSLSTIHFRRC